jgi:hypothetical protein
MIPPTGFSRTPSTWFSGTPSTGFGSGTPSTRSGSSPYPIRRRADTPRTGFTEPRRQGYGRLLRNPVGGVGPTQAIWNAVGNHTHYYYYCHHYYYYYYYYCYYYYYYYYDYYDYYDY